MDTYFASIERSDETELASEITSISESPVVSGLLDSANGLLAILNEKRQVVALNDSFIKKLGIEDPGKVLGLRPGEVLDCIHAHEKPNGCGTTKLCSTCGAAIAIVASLDQDRPIERTCALTSIDNNTSKDLALLVKSQPIRIDNRRFLLLFIQDITKQQQSAALERIFFHDVGNMLSILDGASELLIEENPSELVNTIQQISLRLQKEVEIQQCLVFNSCDYQPVWKKYDTTYILNEIKSFFANHPVRKGKNIHICKLEPPVSFKTDISLLICVLVNMVLNALEASSENEGIRIWLEHEIDSLTFCVWNNQEIPLKIARRIFQRNFSTKEQQSGRGIGTYSMKLFGEKALGGKILFSTSEAGGTIFRFTCKI